MRKIFLGLLLTFCFCNIAISAKYELHPSTYVGDFAEGGDVSFKNKYIGNVSSNSLSLIQNNKTRIHISSGSNADSTAGFVGIFTNGIDRFPRYHLDVAGQIRSTDSAHLATHYGGVTIGTVTTRVGLLTVHGGSVVVTGANGNVIANKFYGDGSGLSNLKSASSGTVVVTTFPQLNKILPESIGQITYNKTLGVLYKATDTNINSFVPVAWKAPVIDGLTDYWSFNKITTTDTIYYSDISNNFLSRPYDDVFTYAFEPRIVEGMYDSASALNTDGNTINYLKTSYLYTNAFDENKPNSFSISFSSVVPTTKINENLSAKLLSINDGVTRILEIEYTMAEGLKILNDGNVLLEIPFENCSELSRDGNWATLVFTIGRGSIKGKFKWKGTIYNFEKENVNSFYSYSLYLGSGLDYNLTYAQNASFDDLFIYDGKKLSEQEMIQILNFHSASSGKLKVETGDIIADNAGVGKVLSYDQGWVNNTADLKLSSYSGINTILPTSTGALTYNTDIEGVMVATSSSRGSYVPVTRMPVLEGLYDWWKLDSTTTLTSAISNRTLTNNSVDKSTVGVYGWRNAVILDGENSMHTSALPSQPTAFMFQINISSIQFDSDGLHGIVGYGGGQDGYGGVSLAYDRGNLYVMFKTATVNKGITVSTNSYADFDGTFKNIAFGFDGNLPNNAKLKLWVNGVEIKGDYNITETKVYNPSGGTYFGEIYILNTHIYGNFILDNVLYYNRLLTDSEVKHNYDIMR